MKPREALWEFRSLTVVHIEAMGVKLMSEQISILFFR